MSTKNDTDHTPSGQTGIIAGVRRNGIHILVDICELTESELDDHFRVLRRLEVDTSTHERLLAAHKASRVA